jgi:hypothetical protein
MLAKVDGVSLTARQHEIVQWGCKKALKLRIVEVAITGIPRMGTGEDLNSGCGEGYPSLKSKF